MTTTLLGLFIAIFASFFLYSPQVEKQRVLTIQKPILITQEKKSPAFYLFQQTQKTNPDLRSKEKKLEKEIVVAAEYLTTEKVVMNKNSIQTEQQVFNRREIASEYDAGFKWAENTNRGLEKNNPINEKTNSSLYAGVKESVLEAATRVNEPSKEISQSRNEKWATIRGKFELSGVGIVPDHKIEFKRIEEGQIRDVGQVDLRAGLYSIDVSSPAGTLVAQIKDLNGNIIGEDRQRVINLQRRGVYFEGPLMLVKNALGVGANPDLPTGGSQKTSSKVWEKNKNNSGVVASLFSGQNQLENSNEEMQNVSHFSSTIGLLHDDKKKYRSTLTIRHVGEEAKTPLFTEKWSEAIVDYISEMQKIQFNSKTPSIIIGQVLIDGKPASGINVEIENKPGVEAIYLDQFLIPSQKLTTTSENGYFLFIALEESAYTIAAFRKQQIVSSNIFIAQDGFVNFQTMKSETKPVSQVIRSFHAFTNEHVETDIIVPELEEALQTQGGSIYIRKHTSQGLAHITSRSADQKFMPFHYFQDARKDYVHLPQIEEIWLTEAQNKKEINDQAKSGIIIGFVPESDYDVYLINEKFDRNNIIFFDLLGRFVDQPVKGGGFILFGVPQGANEVIVQDRQSNRIFSQVFSVYDGQLHISHFKDE